MPPPLRATFMVTRRVAELAGGDEALVDLFASRLRTVLTPQGYSISCTPSLVAAIEESPARPAPMLLLLLRRPLPWETALELWWEGYDIARHGLPFADNALPPDDAFAMLFAKVRDLIAEWPEIVAECA